MVSLICGNEFSLYGQLSFFYGVLLGIWDECVGSFSFSLPVLHTSIDQGFAGHATSLGSTEDFPVMIVLFKECKASRLQPVGPHGLSDQENRRFAKV